MDLLLFFFFFVFFLIFFQPYKMIYQGFFEAEI